MSHIYKISLEQDTPSHLIVDAIYEGGNSIEVISKLMLVGVQGGFRKKMIRRDDGRRTSEEAYVCIYSSGEEIEWRDELDRTLGRFVYWGDNRTAGNPLLETKLKGNKFLEKIFGRLSSGNRREIAPVFVFQKYCSRDMVFCGIAVPGDRRINPHDALVSVWAQNSQGRYQNYKTIFTILDIPQIDRRWLVDLQKGFGYQSQYAPLAWKKWVDSCEYKPLITEKNPIRHRKMNDQLPLVGSLEFDMLDALIDYFRDPFAFEACACKIVQIMDSNIISVNPTRARKDGGRDAVGKYRVGSEANGIELEFALEAKRYATKNSVGVKQTSRLISRIKHRQFGILVTTSYVADQAYKEIIEDEHPIIIISGKDIINILMGAGIQSVQQLQEWLKANF